MGQKVREFCYKVFVRLRGSIDQNTSQWGRGRFYNYALQFESGKTAYRECPYFKIILENESYSASSSNAPWRANKRAVGGAKFAENRRLTNSSAYPSLG